MTATTEIARLVTSTNDLTNVVTNKISDIDSQLNAKKAEVDQHVVTKGAQVDAFIASSQDKQSHFRLTKNQALNANDDGSMPLGWSGGYVKKATLVETVVTGVEPEERSELAQEFLIAINSNERYFARGFKIWELECAPNRGGEDTQRASHIFYQYYRQSTSVTLAAIVKHISGTVPILSWCHGLQATQPAKLCGSYQGAGSRNGYSNCHPYINGQGRDASETTIIQIALPAVVTGIVDLTKNAWGQFAYLGDADLPAFD